MAMQLRYNFRLDPTPGQRIALSRAFGCARVVFNDALRIRKDAFAAGRPYVGDGDLRKRVTTEAKRTPERAWLGDVSSVVLQEAVADLNAAYRNFFNSLSGKRKGRKMAPPRFRSRKDNRQAVRFTKNARFAVTTSGRLSLPKVGEVPVRWSRALPSEPSSVTITLDASGRYFASFVVEVGDPQHIPATAEVGIDLGLTSFAVRSDGEVIDNPRFLRKAECRLKRAQQSLCRKKKGSANRIKARVRVAKLHATVADTRRDWLHKASTTIVRENQAIFVEDLCVTGLARTRLAKSVHDAGWATFAAMLEYKARRYGRTFGRVDRWAPTSQMCSACGDRGSKKPLNVREWTCTACGALHDRDINAALNILALGLRDKSNACGAPVSLPKVAARSDEAGTLSKLPLTAA